MFNYKWELCHSYRSAQTYASVDADIRIGRRGCPHRSTQMLVSVDADDTT
ncbi:hypothetical protein [Leyella stercorea]